MASHDNITWTARAIASSLKMENGKEEFVSYLPLRPVACALHHCRIASLVKFHENC